MDFTHDVFLHPFADLAVLGTHEQSVFYQTAKLRAFLVHNTEYLVLKEKIHVCGVFHIRGDSYVFHIFTVWDDNYGGGVGGVVRPLFFQYGKNMCRIIVPAHKIVTRIQKVHPNLFTINTNTGLSVYRERMRMNYLYASNYFMCRDYYPAHIFSVLKEQRADDPTHTATVIIIPTVNI